MAFGKLATTVCFWGTDDEEGTTFSCSGRLESKVDSEHERNISDRREDALTPCETEIEIGCCAPHVTDGERG